MKRFLVSQGSRNTLVEAEDALHLSRELQSLGVIYMDSTDTTIANRLWAGEPVEHGDTRVEPRGETARRFVIRDRSRGEQYTRNVRDTADLAAQLRSLGMAFGSDRLAALAWDEDGAEVSGWAVETWEAYIDRTREVTP